MLQIIDNKNKSVFSNKVENDINIDFSTKVRTLPGDNIFRTLSLMEQYNKERDNCNRFRLIIAINPICSNVLFNAKTEIVLKDGSVLLDNGETIDKTKYANGATNTISKISYLDAIRNTEYSHPELGGFEYYCGYNIFNNHMLRNDGYVHVNKFKEGNGYFYNTLFDNMRSSEGKIIKQKIHPANSGETEMHLYHFDSIISMRNAFYEKCKEHDGWWGFINPSYINIANRENGDIKTNTLLNNKKSCEFIDLYPDRSLFSFIPKYNKNKNRLEKNWDYCITYPYKNDYETVNRICGGKNQAIKVNFIKKYNTNGVEILECNSYFNHNLKASDIINIYYYNNEGNFQKFGTGVKIDSIGDSVGENKEKIFNIKYSIIEPIIEFIDNENGEGSFFFKKVHGQEECQYYFRKFKKLKLNGEELKSDINKIAFGKNIYGDDVAQIIFTDDIDVSGIVDNNNNLLTEIYLTVVKRNAGHNKWYDDNNHVDDEVEYSHCFGKVTSGIDFSGMKDEPFDYNIHRLHNLKKGDYQDGSDEYRTFDIWGDAVERVPEPLENDIVIDNDEFFGDLVEYSSVLAKETVLSKIYHRVNTAQREVFNEAYRDILQDVIYTDDYDNEGFSGTTYYLNNIGDQDVAYEKKSNINSVIARGSGSKALIYGNIMPEGYYYNPHFRIDIRAKASTVSEAPAKLINCGVNSVFIENKILRIKYPTNYGFYKGDYIALYDKEYIKTYWCEIQKVDEIKGEIEILLDDSLGITMNDFTGANRKYYVYWSPNNVPLNSNLLPKSRKFTWRNIIPQSELSPNNALYDTTFANGRLYIEKNINFFLRRQDPFGKYGLSVPIFKTANIKSNPLDDFNIKGDKQIDFSYILSSFNNLDNCY